MLVYRVGRSKWARSLDGEGARLFGGRWNNIGTPCIYTSESRALAILEYTVNTNIDDIPRSLTITTIEIPDEFQSFPMASLPGDWKNIPIPSSTKEFGTAALTKRKSASIQLPSTVVPEEFNYLLNPLHEASKKFKVISVQDLVYDVRIKTV